MEPKVAVSPAESFENLQTQVFPSNTFVKKIDIKPRYMQKKDPNAAK